jgi:hypothetical protein
MLACAQGKLRETSDTHRYEAHQMRRHDEKEMRAAESWSGKTRSRRGQGTLAVYPCLVIITKSEVA